ncbi:hypothetical protein, partial [Yersinia similis]|uniref:hypothetical protein n=1 Tax=Yersinia similis TaxID=367190 RepID=UPI001C976CC8
FKLGTLTALSIPVAHSPFYDSPAVMRIMRFISLRMMPKTGAYRPPKPTLCENTLSNIGRHVE